MFVERLVCVCMCVWLWVSGLPYSASWAFREARSAETHTYAYLYMSGQPALMLTIQPLLLCLRFLKSFSCSCDVDTETKTLQTSFQSLEAQMGTIRGHPFLYNDWVLSRRFACCLLARRARCRTVCEPTNHGLPHFNQLCRVNLECPAGGGLGSPCSVVRGCCLCDCRAGKLGPRQASWCCCCCCVMFARGRYHVILTEQL